MINSRFTQKYGSKLDQNFRFMQTTLKCLKKVHGYIMHLLINKLYANCTSIIDFHINLLS